MSIAEKAAALLEAVTPNELAAMAPAERRRFADVCRRTAILAETVDHAAKAGVLFDLKSGAPRHE